MLENKTKTISIVIFNLIIKYSKEGTKKIKGWINVLSISKENTINKNIKVILLFILQLFINNDNKVVNKEPHSMLIDNLFDNVKDWKNCENESRIKSI